MCSCVCASPVFDCSSRSPAAFAAPPFRRGLQRERIHYESPQPKPGALFFRCWADPTPPLTHVVHSVLCAGPNAHQHTIQNEPLTRGEWGVQLHIVTDCVTHEGGSFGCQDGSSVPVLTTIHTGCNDVHGEWVTDWLQSRYGLEHF